MIVLDRQWQQLMLQGTTLFKIEKKSLFCLMMIFRILKNQSLLTIVWFYYFIPIAVIDLSDLQGAVKNLTDHQASNASEFLNERETFILVRVESRKVVVILVNINRSNFPLSRIMSNSKGNEKYSKNQRVRTYWLKNLFAESCHFVPPKNKNLFSWARSIRFLGVAGYCKINYWVLLWDYSCE